MLRTAPDCPDRLKITSLARDELSAASSRSRRSPSTTRDAAALERVGLLGVALAQRRQHRHAARHRRSGDRRRLTPMKPRPPITSTRGVLLECRHRAFRATQRPCRCTSDRNRSSDSIANRPREHVANPALVAIHPAAIRRRCSAPAKRPGSDRQHRGRQRAAASVRGTDGDRMHGRERKAAARFQPAPARDRRRRDRAARARRARRSNRRDRSCRPGTACVARSPCTSVSSARGDAIGVDRVARFGEHRRRRIEADERARRCAGPRSSGRCRSPRSSTSIGCVEPIADLPQPGDERPGTS